jgi:predicted nucleotidyltransferase
MRLSSDEINLLKSTLSLLAEDAKIYLFGSRVDDNKRGGDIDLLIVSDRLTRRDLRTLRLEFFKKFGEQKLDIVIDDGSFIKPFNKIIRERAILL